MTPKMAWCNLMDCRRDFVRMAVVRPRPDYSDVVNLSAWVGGLIVVVIAFLVVRGRR